MSTVKCAFCKEDVKTDEFGIDPDHIKACKGRQSPFHINESTTRKD